MGVNKSDLDIFENAVAPLVDVTSILVAYQIGVANMNIGVGALYAGFDAFLVVWMRKPISKFVRWVNPYRIRQTQEKKETGDSVAPSQPPADAIRMDTSQPVLVVPNSVPAMPAFIALAARSTSGTNRMPSRKS